MKKKTKKITRLTVQLAKENFSYDPSTGDLFRITSNGLSKPYRATDAYGYIYVEFKGRQYKGHRIIFMVQGIDPEGLEVDHIDGIKTNNRWENLRLVSHHENLKNRRRRKANSSGIVGVRNDRGRWAAIICVEGKYKHLGSFETKEEAAQARKEAEKKYGFHENHGGKIKPPQVGDN